ncbi:hypothetical protein ACVKXF_002490 [Curtobacterium sp. PvP017]
MVSIRQLDAIGWAQLLGVPALFVGLWLMLVGLHFPEMSPTVVLIVVAVLAAAGFALILSGWSRFGGYDSYRAMDRWVRGGPDPTGVPVTIRRRFLRRQSDQGAVTGWIWISLAVLWAALAVPEVVQGDPAAIGRGVVAVLWAVIGIVRVVFMRRWGARVDELVRETEAQMADPGATPHLDLFR